MSSEQSKWNFKQVSSYLIGVPERLVRTGIGLIGGTVHEIGSFFLPQSMQDSALYAAYIGRTSRFLIEDIGKFDGVFLNESEDYQQEYLQRKVVANVIDIGSLALLHCSPLLILAAAADVSKGGKAVIQQLAHDLQKEGVIQRPASVDNLESFLDELHVFTENLAEQADVPPLSKKELQDLGAEVRSRLFTLSQQRPIDLHDLERLRHEMVQTAQAEHRSLWDTAGAMAHATATMVGATTHGAVTAVGSGIQLLDQHFIQHYREQLGHIRDQGLSTYLGHTLMPYYLGWQRNWDADTQTSTEAWLASFCSWIKQH